MATMSSISRVAESSLTLQAQDRSISTAGICLFELAEAAWYQKQLRQGIAENISRPKALDRRLLMPKKGWMPERARHIDRHHCPFRVISRRKVKGRISIHTASIYSKHSALLPCLPTSRHPRGNSRLASHIEYCSSWLATTVYKSSSSELSDLNDFWSITSSRLKNLRHMSNDKLHQDCSKKAVNV